VTLGDLRLLVACSLGESRALHRPSMGIRPLGDVSSDRRHRGTAGSDRTARHGRGKSNVSRRSSTARSDRSGPRWFLHALSGRRVRLPTEGGPPFRTTSNSVRARLSVRRSEGSQRCGVPLSRPRRRGSAPGGVTCSVRGHRCDVLGMRCE
jgi:hypothetical protein